MKKILSLLLCSLIFVQLFGCSKPSSTVYIKEDVTFELLDVMRIKNNQSNSIYYYYIAMINNQSDTEYDTSLLSFSLTDDKEETVNSINSEMSSPSTKLSSKQSTYVYGYIGFPNNDQKNLGFYFPKTEDFLSFNSVSVREATNDQIQENGTTKFTLFEDSALSIDVDASDTKTDFANGTTTLSNIKVTYTNKTKNRIVVPYLKPKGILNGLDLTKYTDKADFSSITLDEYKKIDFSNNNLPPKTENIESEATGYIVYYLEPEQSVECNIGFSFENAGIDYTDKDTEVFTIRLISDSFGSTTTFNISY